MKKSLIGLLTLLLAFTLACTAQSKPDITQQEINSYLQELVKERSSAKIETERKEMLVLPEKHMNKDLYMVSEYIQDPFQIHLSISGIDGLDKSNAEIYSFEDVAYERLTIDPKSWQKTDPLMDFVEHDDYVKFKDIHSVMLTHTDALQAQSLDGKVTLKGDLSKRDALTSAGELVFNAFPSLLIEMNAIKSFTVEAVFEQASMKPLSYNYVLEAGVTVDGETGTVKLETKAKISQLNEIKEIIVPAEILDRIK